MKSPCGKMVVFFTTIVLVSVLQIKAVPVPDLIYRNTNYKFFTHSPIINWAKAEAGCNDWGGNLATIESSKEDKMLKLLTDTKDYFSCWIGLNDMGTEAGTDASAFVWADGSNSTYRKFGMFPNNTNDSDCVTFRYKMSNGILSNEWQNLDCDQLTDCSYCSRPDNSRGCDLIYGGSCYRAFEVSGGINWLDAQSSCAVWGGDLTSIDLVRDKALLFEYIPNTVGDCWIGLHDRDGDGTFQWVDGTPLSYKRWDIGQPGVATTNECVEMIAPSRNWRSISCDETKNNFLCEIGLTNITTPGYRFGELIDGSMNFRLVIGSIFIFESTTLACKGDVNSGAITWQYSVNSDLSSSEVLTATYMSTQTGVSWLSVDNTKQGYYQCQIDSTNKYTVGVYNISHKTTVAISGSTYTYIVGVDREDVLLLCDPIDSSVVLSTIKWTLLGGNSFTNPLNIYDERSNLAVQSTEVNCFSGANLVTTSRINVKVPEMTIRYGSIVGNTFFSVNPTITTINVPLSTKDMTISINLNGKWNLPNNSYITNSDLTISTFSSQDSGLYKFYIINWDGKEECAMQLRIDSTIADVTAVKEVTFGDSTYGYFTTTPIIHWLAAQLRCNNWQGNLATINSKRIDSLLYYLVTESFTCWIGLNDLTSEAGLNASVFVWVDGSTSTYRQFDTIANPNGEPDDPDGNSDCVGFRYGSNLGSNGWDDRVCDASVFCYFCQKSGDSRGCDLMYEGSCYRAFEVSGGINWLDAQSSCAVWGGDLTSITTERENNLLYTAISDTVSNCWIGLYERDGDGMYQWVDETVLSYTNWTGSPPNANNTNDCVQMNTNGAGSWIATDCEGTSNNFICKMSSTNTDTVVYGFGELTDEGQNFRSLTGNTFMYNSTTLVCKDVNSGAITWQYSINADLSSSEVLTATYMSTQTGVSWLAVDNTKQGYYQCQIDSTSRYTVGVYNRQKTTVAVSEITHNYTVGVDNEDILLLCDPMNSSYDLRNLRWRLTDGMMYANPLNASTLKEILLPQLNTILSCICEGNTEIIISFSIILYVPEITVSYNSVNSLTYSSPYPAKNIVGFNISTQDLLVSVTTPGRWKLPDDTYVTSLMLSFATLSNDTFGLYQFYIINWDGIEVCSIQIILLQGDYTNTPSISTSTLGTIQNDSTLVLNNETITVSCDISNPTNRVHWYYKSYYDSEVIDKTSLSTFSVQTGVSSLEVSSNQPGYYSCVININIIYTVSVADRATLVEITNFDSPSRQVNYTAGSTNSMLYYSHANIPDSSLRWTTDTVTNGADTQYSIEYPNPVLLSRVFSEVGAGVHTFSCFYRMSPVTLLGSLQLVIRDSAEISINYEGYNNTFSDGNNPNFPSPQQISIPTGTTNVTLSCHLTVCVGIVKLEKSWQKMQNTSPFIIPKFTSESEGEYSLKRETNAGKQYTTAYVSIQAYGSSSVIQPAYIAAPVVIMLIFICLILIVIFTLWILRNKKKNFQFHRRTFSNESSGSPMKSQIIVENNALNTVTSFTPGYSLLDYDKSAETKFTESEDQANNYENIIKIFNTDSPTYQEASEVVEPLKIPIPLDLFKSHIDRIWKTGGALLEEYESLGTNLLKYSTITATLEENRIRNRFKFIYPYDKSRVILNTQDENNNSDYINASRIPGIYVKESFIATQAPKENTLKDFWQMVLENKIVTIVMVTNLVESGRKKCVEYFPLKVGKKVIIGPYEIILETEEIKPGYTIRMMSIQYKERNTHVKQFHFTAWPDHDIPTLYDELLLFISKVQEGLIKTKSPILVHCSAGVGRTGTFITLYNLLAAIQQSKPISIYNVVHEMREHRPQMVQTFAQYKFIYLSVLEMLLGNTSIPTAEFMDTFNLYMQSENEGYVSVFFQQYSELNYQCEKGFDHVCNDALEDFNSKKNPVKDNLPCDDNRVRIFSSYWPGDYINATYLDNKEIIVTIHPTSETLRDFHQLIYQMEPSLVVMLCTNMELQLIEQGHSERVLYWPKYGEDITAEPFSVTCEASEKTLHFIRNTLNMNHKLDQRNRSFTQIIANNWNNKEEPHLKRTVVLLQTILEFKQHYPTSPIIIHCVDGAGKSGVIYTVYRGIVDSTEKGYIDIFHIVKKLRNERMKSVTTLTHFVSCFTLMNAYSHKI